MKLEIRVDVGPSESRWIRRALLLGVPVAAMVITGSVFGTPKHHFDANTKISSKEMNDNFEDLDARSTTAWASYACDVKDSTGVKIGGDETACYYRRVGDSVEIRLKTYFAVDPAPNPARILMWPLPAGLTLDPTKVPDPNAGPLLGVAQVLTSSGYLAGTVESDGLSSVGVVVHGDPDFLATSSASVAVGTIVKLSFGIPVK